MNKEEKSQEEIWELYQEWLKKNCPMAHSYHQTAFMAMEEFQEETGYILK